MTETSTNLLRQYAAQYEQPKFVFDDPVQFPHRFTNVRDIEIVGFIASWLAYGSRKAFIKITDQLLSTMASYSAPPYTFISEGHYNQMKRDYPATQRLYRFFTYSDFYDLCETLAHIYRHHKTLEDAVVEETMKNEFQNLGVKYIAGLTNLFFLPNSESDKRRSKRLGLSLQAFEYVLALDGAHR